MELMHSDVFGHVSVLSLGWSKYYVSFINEFYKMTWLYFLKKNSKVFEKFQEFNTLIENQTNNNIKVFRMENGGKYCGKAFHQFYRHHDIAQQNTNPYMPQQNEVAKRTNRTLMEKARCILSEAINTTFYIVNSSLTSSLVNKNTYGAWVGKNSSLAHLIFFWMWCLYAHFEREKEKTW